MMDSKELHSRNAGYIQAQTQDKMAECRVLVAGCGVGSAIAETAARLGFCRFVLIDPDTVSVSNLNRQTYTSEDIGLPKVEVLARHLRRVNPSAQIATRLEKLSAHNAAQLAEQVDFVFDTIDFLDMSGIVALHDACAQAKVPVATAFSAGFGAVATFFPPACRVTLRDLLGLPRDMQGRVPCAAQAFENLLEPLSRVLDPGSLATAMSSLQQMAAGVPCPAPNLAVGASLVASLCTTMAVRYLAGQPVSPAPHLCAVDLGLILSSSHIDPAPKAREAQRS
ncbi:MAG: ThiF family adenylyltransferase [Myxococcota bacterium]|jgi:molybdopterin/thiamine biosynthesis adenylyltransferase|nr:ThiF family adenylyltransferase [Myxococcota bacterium]